MVGRKPVLGPLAFIPFILLAGRALVSLAAPADRKAGIVTHLQGSATVLRGPSEVGSRPLKFRDDVFLDDRITTGPVSAMRILLGGKALLTLREESTAQITERPGVTTVNVGAGHTHINVDRARLKSGELIEVRTPNAVAQVTGTILVTDVSRDDRCDDGSGTVVSTFTTLSGQVRVTPLDPVTGLEKGPAVSLAPNETITIGGCETDGRPRPLRPLLPR